MKTIRVQDLSGRALRYVVAMAVSGELPQDDGCGTYWVKLDGKDRALDPSWAQHFCPESIWEDGGPIIEREHITVEQKHDGWWRSSIRYNYQDKSEHLHLGETPLLAAMRCFVASKLGESVQVPASLVT